MNRLSTEPLSIERASNESTFGKIGAERVGDVIARARMGIINPLRKRIMK
jgi:hypothetical protein